MWCCSRTAKVLIDGFLGFGDPNNESGFPNGTPPQTPNPNNSGPGVGSSTGKPNPDVFLDSTYLGHDVVIIKNGLRMCGSGGALASAPLIQTKSYFEVKFQQEGRWGIGVATRNTSMENGPFGNDVESWILRNTGELFHNGMSIGKIEKEFQEGDILGVTYDHIELNFYVNGHKGEIAFSNVRGTVYPALYVDDGAVLDIMFDGFAFPVPSGFDRIMREKSLL